MLQSSSGKAQEHRISANDRQEHRPAPQPPPTTPLVLVPSVNAASNDRLENGSSGPKYPEWALAVITAVLAYYTYRSVPGDERTSLTVSNGGYG